MNILGAVQAISRADSVEAIAALLIEHGQQCVPLSRTVLQLVADTAVTHDAPMAVIARVIATGVAEDSTSEVACDDPYFRALPTPTWRCAAMREPQGSCVGALYIECPGKIEFSAAQLHFLEELLTHAGLAIQRVQRHREAVLQLHQARERIREIERSGLDARMVSGFTHLLRNALTSTVFCFEALQDAIQSGEPATSADLREALDGARHGVERALRVTGSVSEYARASRPPPPGQPAAAAVARCVQSVIYRLSKELGVQQIQVDQVIAVNVAVQISESHLQTMVANLLANARDALSDYTPAAGRRIDIEASSVDGRVSIRVQDNGPGLSTEAAARLFEPFFTTKGGRGSGLGLALCRKLAGQNGGEVLIDSVPGVGTRATLVLPAGPPLER